MTLKEKYEQLTDEELQNEKNTLLGKIKVIFSTVNVVPPKTIAKLRYQLKIFEEVFEERRENDRKNRKEN